jgi:YVTN family beta-propeller protein
LDRPILLFSKDNDSLFGDAPSKIAVNPINGFVYVSNSGSDSVHIIDPSTQRVVEEVAVGTFILKS